MNSVLYGKQEADALTASEKNEPWRHEAELLKAKLIIEHLENIESLLDLGCGWGQTLRQLVGKIPVLAGADESADRLGSLKDNELGIQTYQCKSTKLVLGDHSFDAILMSHILHEVKLFGNKDDLSKTLSEISRVLKTNGSFVIIDHRDPGEGSVSIEPGDQLSNLFKFQERFKLKKIKFSSNNNIVTMPVRDCHDFVTKIWSLDNAAEDLEMNETHTVINQDSFASELEAFNFKVKINLSFNPISKIMDYYGIKLIKGEDWGRQVFIVASPIF